MPSSTNRRDAFCRVAIEVFVAVVVAAIPPATAFFAVTALRFYGCGLAVETAVSFVSASAAAFAAWGVRGALSVACRGALPATPGPAALGLVVAAVVAFALTRRTPEAPTLFALVGAAAALGIALDVAWGAREAPAPRPRPTFTPRAQPPAAPRARRGRGGEDAPLLQGMLGLEPQGVDSEC